MTPIHIINIPNHLWKIILFLVHNITRSPPFFFPNLQQTERKQGIQAYTCNPPSFIHSTNMPRCRSALQSRLAAFEKTIAENEKHQSATECRSFLTTVAAAKVLCKYRRQQQQQRRLSSRPTHALATVEESGQSTSALPSSTTSTMPSLDPTETSWGGTCFSFDDDDASLSAELICNNSLVANHDNSNSLGMSQQAPKESSWALMSIGSPDGLCLNDLFPTMDNVTNCPTNDDGTTTTMINESSIVTDLQRSCHSLGLDSPLTNEEMLQMSTLVLDGLRATSATSSFSATGEAGCDHSVLSELEQSLQLYFNCTNQEK